MTTRTLAVLSACLLLPAAIAHAGSTFGADYTTGQGYSGFDAKGKLTLDLEAAYSGSVQYSRVYSTSGNGTRSNQITLGLDHLVEDDWDLNGSLTGWKDDISGVKYIGPSVGFVYTMYRDDRDIRRPDQEEDEAPSRDASDQILVVAYNSDLFYYQTGADSSSHTITQGAGRAQKTIVVPPFSSPISLFQFHPSLELDAPLFGAKVTPSIQAGHYFYSRNPENIEQVAGLLHYSAASANGASGLVGGLILNSGQVGLDVELPWNWRIHGSLGLQQLAEDESWAATQGLSLSGLLLGRRVKANFAWNRSIEEGATQDLYTVGLTYYF